MSAICLHSFPTQGGRRPGILESFLRRSRTAGRKTRGPFSFYQRAHLPPPLVVGWVLWRPRKCHCWQEHCIWLSHEPAAGRMCSISPMGQDSTSGRGPPWRSPPFQDEAPQQPCLASNPVSVGSQHLRQELRKALLACWSGWAKKQPQFLPAFLWIPRYLLQRVVFLKARIPAVRRCAQPFCSYLLGQGILLGSSFRSCIWIFKNNFTYLFLAVLGLCCCVSFLLVVVSRGYSPVAVHRPLLAAASLISEN